jgi:hypothetical protein
LCYNLDVTYIEKNEMENILGTILDINGKMKDDLEPAQTCKKWV